MIDTLVENIALWKDTNELQNRNAIIQLGGGLSLVRVAFDVVAQMAAESQETDLDAGTYYFRVPNDVDNANAHSWDNLYIPKGTIITQVIVDTHEAKAGAGTITPRIGTDSLTAVNAAGVTDDTAALADPKVAADADVNVVVAGGVVTAGAFVMWLFCLRGIDA